MMKKIIMLIIMIIFIIGCVAKESGIVEIVNSGSNIEEDDIQKRGPYKIVAGNIDSDIFLEITSKPLKTAANTTIEFQYKASQRGYNASDFEYTYELPGIETLEVDGLLDEYKFLDQINKKFYNLENGQSYTFQVWARNKKTGKISPSEIYTFNVEEEIVLTTPENITLNYVQLEKVSINEGEEIKVIMSVTNVGKNEVEVMPVIGFNTTSSYNASINKDDKFESLSENGIVKIAAEETIKIEKKYKVIEGTVSGNNITGKFFAIGQIIIPLTEKKTIFKNASFKVISDKKMDINIEEITAMSTTVVPGEKEIKIRYQITTFNNAEVLVKKITPTFTLVDGTDVTSDWIDTNADEVKKITAVGYITRSYTLSPNATSGDVLIDASAVAVGENNVQITASNAQKGDEIKVLKKGVANIEAWIAYPEGIIDGIVSEEQEFTIYGRINYNGNLQFTNFGTVELDIEELDGIRIVAGTRIQQINMNQQMEWKLKAGKIPISGKIKLKVTKKPIEKETNGELEFINTEKVIPLQVVEKSKLELETGIEIDIYGGKDGKVKDNSDFSVYAKVVNANNNIITGKVKISLDLSEIAGMELATDEVFVKEGEVGGKIIWNLHSPIGNRTGSLRFNILEVPEDDNSGEVTEHSETETLRITVVHPGELKLRKVYSDWTKIEPGKDGVPIKFDIENVGDTDIRLLEVKANFTQRGTDLSEKWKLTECSIDTDTIIGANITRTITAYYKLQENLLDGSDILGAVTISGEVRGEEIYSKEILEDKEPRYDYVMEIKDIIPPVAIAKSDVIEAKVGEIITFSGEDSTDNNEIRYYSWDFDRENGIEEDRRGKVVTYSYNEAGIYKVVLQVNDMDNNGPATSEILITITE